MNRTATSLHAPGPSTGSAPSASTPTPAAPAPFPSPSGLDAEDGGAIFFPFTEQRDVRSPSSDPAPSDGGVALTIVVALLATAAFAYLLRRMLCD